MMNPICIIPARSGSKGLPDKNMLFLDGKPMIFYTIQAAIDSCLFDIEDIIVSTDSRLYQSICQDMGITVFLRNKELSTDTATTFDVLKDSLLSYDEEQTFFLLQATSPLRGSRHICEAYELFCNEDVNAVVSVTEADKSKSLYTSLSADGILQDIVGIDKGYCRQSFPTFYYPNGAIYISKKGTYLTNSSFFTKRTKAYIMPKSVSLDIDEKQDFIHALGDIFFNYRKREKDSALFYHQAYKERVDADATRIILGDSRLVPIQLDDFLNYSLNGVTVATLLSNHDTWLTHKIDEIFVSIGINDFISEYDERLIYENFLELFSLLSDKKIYLTTIPYTIFRIEVDNNKVRTLNEKLLEFSVNNGIPILDVNKYLSSDGELYYYSSTDGLHFKYETCRRLEKLYQDFVNQTRKRKCW